MEDDGARRRFLDALEDERRKIHVFQRELPLCLHLVTHTIDGMRSHIDVLRTVSDHGPVLEDFIPLNPSLSSSDEEDSTHDAKKDAAERLPGATPDWLQSVQLWTQQPRQSSPNKELPCKPVALNATKGGGAFHPFDKDKDKRADAELPASSTSAVVGDSGDKPPTSHTDGHEEEKGGEKEKEGQSQPNSRKPRRCWAPELHRRFLQALQQLGGSHAATPKQIRELMKVDELTNDEVKSHLQKYRLHTTRRPSTTTTAQISSAAAAAAAAPQFVVVGSCIWVPQAEYVTGAFGSTANVSVYAPVAQPDGKSGKKQPQQKSSESEVRPSGETGDGSSSSSQTTSSPPC